MATLGADESSHTERELLTALGANGKDGLKNHGERLQQLVADVENGGEGIELSIANTIFAKESIKEIIKAVTAIIVGKVQDCFKNGGQNCHIN